MPVLRNKKTGREEFVPNELLEQAAASGEFDMPADLSVQVTTPAGRVVEGPFADLQTADQTLPLAPTGEVELAERQKQARIEEEHSGFVEGAKALGQGALEGITFGGYGAATRLLDPVAAEEMAEREKARPGLAVAGNVVGSIAPALLSGGSGAAARIASLTPAGAASKLGARIAAPGGLGARTLGFGAEGALAGFGQGVHQLAMAEDPLTVERAASVLSSNALLGGGLGGGLGVLSKAAEKGIVRARDLVREAGERYATKSAVAPELAALDAAGLRGAEKAELEAIEASRVPERASVADEIVKYHQQKRADKPWLATKGDDEFKEVAKVALKADRRMQGLLDNPIALAENPGSARRALQQDQHALEQIVASRPRIEAKIAIETEESASPAASGAAGFNPRLFNQKTFGHEESWVDLADVMNGKAPTGPSVVDPEIPKWLKEKMSGPLTTSDEDFMGLYQNTEPMVIQPYLNGDKEAIRMATNTDPEWHGFSDHTETILRKKMTMDEAIKAGDEAIARSSVPEDVITYRSAGHLTIGGRDIIESAPEEIERLRAGWMLEPGEAEPFYAPKVGDVFDPSPRFLSTTPDAWGAAEFKGPMLEIELPKGSPALYLRAHEVDRLGETKAFPYSDENELLLQRDLPLRIKAIRYNVQTASGKKTVFTVEPDFAAKPPTGSASTDLSPAATPGPSADPSAATGATRLASLDKAEQLLATNKSLQAKLLELERTPASQKLDDIAKARDALSKPAPRGFLRDASTAYSVAAVAGLAPGGPIGAIAAVAAPRVARRLADWVANRLAKASAEAAGRSAKSLDAIFGTAEKVARKAPPLATRALAAASFGTSDDKAERPRTLAGAYKARESEILSQVEAGPDGVPVMRRSARQAVADRLDGVAAVSPKLADSIETMAARRVEFLASKLPKRPDLGHVPAGPDMWQPSEQQIRTFARLVSAVEDPGAVEERVANGSVLPDEVEAYRTVYPERYMDMQRQIIERLPTLRTRLPFERRLSLSIFTGVPVDPALSPPVLRVMQSMYAAEPGTEGGTQPPQAQPQFGSVSREQPTPAQQRGGVTEI